jgi:hypothetical protein
MSYRDDEYKRLKADGRSKHEIAYFLADNQREYEPLLKDPTTPEKIIYDIVNTITLLPLKLLAFKHPNISARSQRYILDKADKKDYQKELVEAFISNEKTIIKDNWVRIRKWSNTAQRFDICVMELLEEQNNIFTTENLNIILNSFTLGIQGQPLKEKSLQRYLLGVLDHDNFNVSILDGEFINKKGRLDDAATLKTISASKNKDDIYVELYKLTKNEVWLPQEAKDVFLF